MVPMLRSLRRIWRRYPSRVLLAVALGVYLLFRAQPAHVDQVRIANQWDRSAQISARLDTEFRPPSPDPEFEFVDPIPQDRLTPNYYLPDAQRLLAATHARLFVASGFVFCAILNGASFDALVQLKALKGSVAERNPDIAAFINIIDQRAYEIYRALLRRNHKADMDEVKRIACYTAAEGNSAFANMTQSRLLQSLHPLNYFKHVLPAIMPHPSPARKRFKMAYLLMIHELHGFPHAVYLLDLLDDGDAIILIHIDARPKSSPLIPKLTSWLSNRKQSLGRDPNIHFAQHRYFNIWGHISLVFTQLSGFWELLDMADWDYLVNLSNYDFPIKSNSVIHSFLSQPQYKDKNWIEYWEDTGT